MTEPHPRDAEEARDRLRRFVDVEAVAIRLDKLSETIPSLDSRIVTRLLGRAPEVVSTILDDIEAGR